MSTNDAMRELWNGEDALGWVEHPDRYDRMLGPFNDRVLAAAGLGAGHRVLDVGCGSGDLSRAAARAVGPEGAVVGLDISKPLLEVARRRTLDAPGAPTRFVEGDAQQDAVPGGPFDALISRFGVMFFDDPVAAFANLRSVATGDGRLSFVAWQPVTDNPWILEPVLAAAGHVGMPPVPEPGEPGPFAFGDPDHVRRVLDGAGWRDVGLEPVVADLHIGAASSPEEAVRYYEEETIGRMLLRGAAPDARAGATSALRDLFEGCVRDGEVRMRGAAWLVTARNG